MSRPRQVEEQIASVQKLYEEMTFEGDDAPEGDDDTPPPSPPPPPAPETTVPVAEYNALVNKYNADVGALNGRVQQLETLLAGAPPKPADTTPKSLITDAERSEYGESIDVMRRAAREEVAGEMSELRKQLQDAVAELSRIKEIPARVEQLQARDKQTRVNQFWERLTGLVPDWKTINNDANFHAWLLEVDAVTGRNRQVFLEDAQKSLDAQRVANIFGAWKNLTATSDIDPPKPSKRQELESQVAPGKSKTSSTGQKSEKKVYTRNEITQFYKDVQLGHYRGREAEKASREADIFEATREGRVRE